MALKYKVKSKDEVPVLQSHYVERDGAFFLDAEGVAEKSKLDEFRTNNVALLKQVEDLKKKYDGIDPDMIRPGSSNRPNVIWKRRLRSKRVKWIRSSPAECSPSRMI